MPCGLITVPFQLPLSGSQKPMNFCTIWPDVNDLSTPSLGITFKIFKALSGWCGLSTPSLGITICRNERGKPQVRAEGFQLPLSGSLEFDEIYVTNDPAPSFQLPLSGSLKSQGVAGVLAV